MVFLSRFSLKRIYALSWTIHNLKNTTPDTKNLWSPDHKGQVVFGIHLVCPFQNNWSFLVGPFLGVTPNIGPRGQNI